MGSLRFPEFVQALGSAAWFGDLLSASLKAVAIFLAAGLCAFAARRSSAAVRHAIWLLALSSAAALPALSHLLPPWEPAWLPAAGLLRTSHSALRTFAGTHHSLPITHHFNWPAVAAAVWLLVAAALALRWLAGHIALARLTRRASRPADPALGGMVEELRAAVGIRRGIRLLVSAEIETPITAGVLRPAVVLPPDFDEWPAAWQRAALLHELAHVARFDTLAQAMARLACIAYWFNPLAWVAARALREECERACDDYVLAGGIRASDYARELLDLACALPALKVSPSAVALARRHSLRGRLLAILDARASRRPVSQLGAATALAVAIALAGPLAAIRAPRARPVAAAAIRSPRISGIQPAVLAEAVALPAALRPASMPARARSAAPPKRAPRQSYVARRAASAQPHAAAIPVSFTLEQVFVGTEDGRPFVLALQYLIRETADGDLEASPPTILVIRI
jgi:beta-lactamase regulating signal transducer with metallopeptidase domain